MRTRTTLRGLIAIATLTTGIAFATAPAQAEPAGFDALPMLAAPQGLTPGGHINVGPTAEQLAKLTPEERKGVAVQIRRETTGATPKSVKEGIANGGVSLNACGHYQDYIYAWNGTDDIWQWSLQVDWCWNGGQVTSIQPAFIQHYVYGWASVLGWSYDGTIDKEQWDYYGDRWVYRNYAEGHFVYCPIRIGCFQHMYPWETVDAYANGGAGTAGWGGASHT